MLVVIETMRMGEPEIVTCFDGVDVSSSTATSLTALTNWFLRCRGFDETVSTLQMMDAFHSMRSWS